MGVFEKLDQTVLAKLFLRKKFIFHRVFGLLYLIQWIASFYYYNTDYEWYSKSFLVYSLSMCGFIQSIGASLTFTFLPDGQQDPGYYSDKSTLSYQFVTENIFFAGLLFFQNLYMSDQFYSKIQSLWIIENLLVFLPYILIRPFFPKTRFRDSLKNEKNKTDANYKFFYYFTWVTKIFYLWGKHFIGFFLNYIRFVDGLEAIERQHLYNLLIVSGFAVTISMFLHTLKFKKYMGPKLSFGIYVASYMATFYGFYLIYPVFYKRLDLTLLCIVQIAVDFLPQYAKAGWFVFVMIYLNMRKIGMVGPVVEQYFTNGVNIGQVFNKNRLNGLQKLLSAVGKLGGGKLGDL